MSLNTQGNEWKLSAVIRFRNHIVLTINITLAKTLLKNIKTLNLTHILSNGRVNFLAVKTTAGDRQKR